MEIHTQKYLKIISRTNIHLARIFKSIGRKLIRARFILPHLRIIKFQTANLPGKK